MYDLEVVSEEFTPTVNIGGNTANKFARIDHQVFEFDIDEAGDYIITFYPDAARNADFVLGPVSLQAVEFLTTDIKPIDNWTIYNLQWEDHAAYDLSGRQLPQGHLRRGINIIDGHKVLVR